MSAQPSDALRRLGTSAVQSVAVASAALRLAVARLIAADGHPRAAERRAR